LGARAAGAGALPPRSRSAAPRPRTRARTPGGGAHRRGRALTRVLQMLSGINTALVRIRDRNEVIAEACRLAHRTGGYAMAMVALIEPSARVARPAAWAGFDFLADPGEEFAVGTRESEDTSLMG